MADSESKPIIVMKEQARMIIILPKNCREWKEIWIKHLSRLNLDHDSIGKIINGARYEMRSESE